MIKKSYSPISDPRYFAAQAAAITVLVALTLLAGCRQGGVIRPQSLPSEFAAPASLSGTEVDLSQLVNHLPPDLRIVPGDILRVTVVTGPHATRSDESPLLRVNDHGQISMPVVGEVRVAGLTLTQAEEQVKADSVARGIYLHPQISVIRESRKTNRIMVVGAVREPGVKEIPLAECHLLSALVYAGGMADDSSSFARVQSRSSGGSSQRINLNDRGSANDISLTDGDVVMIERREPAVVYVMGLVQRPQEIEIPVGKSMRLLDSIAAAGGRRLQVANKVKIIRYVENREDPIVIATSIDEAKQSADGNVTLAPGDVVSVEDTAMTLAVEMLQSFVRFGFSSAIPFF